MSEMRTPSQTSPWNYFQERYRSDGWRLLCCTIMLNLTSGRQLEKVHRGFFQYYPDAESAACGDIELMELLLMPLGMQTVRANRIVAMSRAYLSWNGVDPDDLPGIGKYGRDSYEIFIRGNLVMDVQDKELKKYVRWAQEITKASTEEDPPAPCPSDGV